MTGMGCAALRRLAIAGAMAAVPIVASRAQTDTGRAVAVRLVGVYDSETGAPVENAKVRDVLTGLSVLTTKTGTAFLIPGDTAAALISVTCTGYRPLMLTVGNARRDTTPLTLLLEPAGTMLPLVVSTAPREGVPADDEDVVARLERVGFYDRLRNSVAPSVRFVTAATLAHWNIHSLDEIGAVSGRPLCTANLYVDGAKVSVPSRRIGPGLISRTFTSPADEIVNIGDIAGIETYTGLEIPSQFGRDGCVSLVWTK